MTYGVLTNGFEPKPYSAALVEIQGELRASFGDSIPLDDDSVFGRLAKILAEREAAYFEQLEALTLQFRPSSAEGAWLDTIASYTGIQRGGGAKSTALVFLSGDSGVEVTELNLRTVTLATQFTTQGTVTLLPSAARTPNTTYNKDVVVTNGDSCFVCVTAGTSSSATGYGPLISASETENVTDGTVEWRFIGDGTAHASVLAEAVSDGALVARAFDLTDIATPVAGVYGAINPYDAAVGSLIESDESLRLRRDNLVYTGVQASGGNRIRRALLALQDVSEARVFVNTSDVVDGDGVPAHGIEAVVLGGDGQAIAQTLYEVVTAGSAMGGNTEYSILDANGATQTIRFSRPTDVDVYVKLELSVVDGEYAGDAEVLRRLLEVQLKTGRDVVSSQMAARALATPGVVDCIAKISTSPSPTTTITISISLRQIARLDSSRVTITTTYVTP